VCAQGEGEWNVQEVQVSVRGRRGCTGGVCVRGREKGDCRKRGYQGEEKDMCRSSGSSRGNRGCAGVARVREREKGACKRCECQGE
jgi:hypothetical protein